MSHDHQKKLPDMDSIIENMEKEVSNLTDLIDSNPKACFIDCSKAPFIP